MIEFGVLGPLTVTRGGLDLATGTPMLRRLLAVLLAVDGRPLGVDALIDALWEDPPRTARKTLLVYIHRLRRLLADDAWVMHSAMSGYTLSLGERSRLDAYLFRDLIHDAAANPAMANPVAAVDCYRAALRLWRGPAYFGMRDVALVRTAADRLDEQRLDALERCLQLELDLGRHADLIAEMSAAADEHPFREALQGQLMLALYRSNRQAEALEAYRRTYRLLGSELGIEPSAALQELHGRMLRTDPALQLRMASPVNQLPMITPTLVGRDAELTAIAGVLTTGSSTGPSVVAVSGIGGIGKTTLAVRAAGECLWAYPDGCLFVDLRATAERPAEPMAVLGGFLRALGVPARSVPQDLDERLGLFRATTAPRRVLFVLDNALNEAQLRLLLPGGAGCAVLVTSRRILAGLDCRLTTDLSLLSAPESLELLYAIVGPDRLDDDKAAVDSLVQACAGLPLAVRIVAARLVGQRDLTPVRLAELLHDRERALPELVAGDLGVRASLDLSYQRLSASATGLLHRLGATFQLDVTVRTANVLMAGVEPAMRELVDANLLSPAGERYRLHDLVRLYAVERARQEARPDDLDASVRAMIVWYLHAAFTMARTSHAGRMPPRVTIAESPVDGMHFADFASAITWCEAESENLIGAVSEAAARGWHTEAWQLAYALRTYFQARHLMDEWRATHRIALDSADRLGDPMARARILESLGVATIHQQRYAESRAHYEEALHLYEQVNDPIGIGRCHEGLGSLTDMLGQPEPAEHHYRLALAHYGDAPYYATTVQLNLGTLYGGQGRFAEAIDVLRPVLEWTVAQDNWEMACFTHHNLGSAHRGQGSFAQAEHHAREEIAIADRNRLAAREARGWELLGDVYARQHRPEAAQTLRRAADLYERLRDPRADIVRTQLETLA